VSWFNGCRCIKDTRTRDGKKLGAELVLQGHWGSGPLGKSTKKIPRRIKTALGVEWIKVTFAPRTTGGSEVGGGEGVPSSPTQRPPTPNNGSWAEDQSPFSFPWCECEGFESEHALRLTWATFSPR